MKILNHSGMRKKGSLTMKRDGKKKNVSLEKIGRKANSLGKRTYQALMVERKLQKKLVFIVGCQRSGTTMMTRIFEKDWNSKVYTAFSKLSSRDSQNIRLDPLPEVAKAISRDRAPLIVMKPLVESQNVLHMLGFFSDSRALWMFRNFRDVASSNIVKFGQENGIDDLRPIYLGDKSNWRSDNVSDSTRDKVRKYFSEKMDPYDAAALFWYTRNVVFFEQELDKNDKVILCKYEDLVKEPSRTMRYIYNQIGVKFPGERIVGQVHMQSIGKGKSVLLSEEIKELCKELYDRLEQAYFNRSEKRVAAGA
jgi:hypothetical protein